ncbi:MAG: polysaccharide deacetylase family protein [Erysipelotrichaceae bacterium]|nr:polysaccharide deacetylase family protein [Erysipelotrichaceae bacterium]
MKNKGYLKAFLIGSLALLVTGLLAFGGGRIVFNVRDNQEFTFEYSQKAELPEVKAKYQKMLGLFTRDIPITEKKGEIGEQLGSYELKWKAGYEDREGQLTIKVNIVDTTAPVITLVQSGEHYTDYGEEYAEEGYSAYDAHDGDLTDRVQVESDGTTVNYTVSDSSGNSATVSREIVYRDISAPQIVLNGETVISVELGGKYEEPGYTATDRHDGDLSEAVSISGEVDSAKKGTYALTYSVADAAGNLATAVRVVSVYEKNGEHVSTSGGIVYLTFDDGPGCYTMKLLDILDKYNVKVTFFVTGNREDYRYCITEAAKRGHTVAAHSYSHSYAKCYTSLEDYWKDLNKVNEMIYELTGSYSHLVRLPGGSSNTVSRKYANGIITEICNSLNENGYRYTDWNVSSGDAGSTEDPTKVAENVIRGIRRHYESIVLQHDIKGYSVDAVERIIVWGLANGYVFLPMTYSSPVFHHSIRN